MLTPCPHCDQQVRPDADGACPLCGGTVIETCSDTEASEDPKACGSKESEAEQAAETAVTGADDLPPAADTAADQSAGDAPVGEDVPVWAQGGEDDIVAPEDLLDDEEEEECGAVDSDAPPIDEADAEPAQCAVGEECASAPKRSQLLLSSLLLVAVLAVQVGIAFWIKQQSHMAGFAPIFGFALVLVLAVVVLFATGRGALGNLGLRPFTSFHFLMALFVAPATSVIAAQAGRLISHLAIPDALRPPTGDTLSHLALAIAGLCVLPALALELTFRGMIARSLAAKFGSFIGMLLTSVAFAASFVWPEKIAEWFVISVVLQLFVMATRSLPVSIILYSLCAATTLLIGRYPDALNIPGYTHPEVSPFIPWPLLTASAVVMVAMMGALYLTRVRYVDGNGKSWSPGYFSLERPPQDAQVKLISPDAHGALVVVLVVIFAGFLITVFWEHQRGVQEVQAYKWSKVRIPGPPPQTGDGQGMPKNMPGMMGPGMGMPKGTPGMKPKGIGVVPLGKPNAGQAVQDDELGGGSGKGQPKTRKFKLKVPPQGQDAAPPSKEAKEAPPPKPTSAEQRAAETP